VRNDTLKKRYKMADFVLRFHRSICLCRLRKNMNIQNCLHQLKSELGFQHKSSVFTPSRLFSGVAQLNTITYRLLTNVLINTLFPSSSLLFVAYLLALKMEAASSSETLVNLLHSNSSLTLVKCQNSFIINTFNVRENVNASRRTKQLHF
jgi:hypothetical protein